MWHTWYVQVLTRCSGTIRQTVYGTCFTQFSRTYCVHSICRSWISGTHTRHWWHGASNRVHSSPPARSTHNRGFPNGHSRP